MLEPRVALTNLEANLLWVIHLSILDQMLAHYYKCFTFSLVSGLGFGVMSGAFSITNILADAAGPGTVGINDDSQFFYLFSALTTLCFILFHICWTVILFHSCDHKKHVMTSYVFLSHLTASYIVSSLVYFVLLIINFSLNFSDFFESKAKAVVRRFHST